MKSTILFQDKINQLLKDWFLSLILNTPNLNLLSSDFGLEDGMSKEDYVNYELQHFKTLSPLYDLDDNFSIKILNGQKINTTSISLFIYIINKYNQVAFKMTITVLNNKQPLIIGNNYYSQIVPKFVIEKKNNNFNISSFSLAIKSPKVPINIISQQAKLLSFNKGANFNNDGFYYANFLINKQIPSYLKLYLSFQQKITEKRIVFFDGFSLTNQPFTINQNNLLINNTKYPVHLYYRTNSGEEINIPYPRNITPINLDSINKMIITDNLDHDWIIK